MSAGEYRSEALNHYAEKCAACGATTDLSWINSIHIHHIDADRTNGSLENLIPLCRTCHDDVHSGFACGRIKWELSNEIGETEALISLEIKSDTMGIAYAAIDGTELSVEDYVKKAVLEKIERDGHSVHDKITGYSRVREKQQKLIAEKELQEVQDNA